MKKTNKELFEAIELNDGKKLKECIAAGANIEAKNNYGWTPLMLAAANDHSECCKMLIDAGADIEAKDRYGCAPLMFAVLNDCSDCCKTLIDAGANIEEKGDSGLTPLMLAAYNGRSECCKMLIDAGADIEAKDDDGWTLLMCATLNAHLDCCKTFIDADVFVTLKSDEKKTALDYAIEYDYKNIIELLKPLITPERELTEHILLNQDIENEVFDGIRIEKMPTINPYYILSDTETNIPVGTFTPSKGLDGLEIYDGYQTLDEAIDNEPTQTNAQPLESII